MKESVKSVIHIPTDLKFVEYATVGDELQFTYLFSDSEITASTAKPNDIPNNSSGNNCDSEEIKESPVSMNVRASLRKFSCCNKSDSTKCKQNETSLNRNGYAHDSQCAVGSVPTCCSFSVRRRLKIIAKSHRYWQLVPQSVKVTR
ncbi:conserved hypothetical protein [Trichinella spiralis]|uniref:hypothetical protein n=1 Tax=Trichinella spiralis TaxID=6334 RepID=UPI0001EFDDA8|nr:conserved hypothetical protein [Trichinella spiralis]